MSQWNCGHNGGEKGYDSHVGLESGSGRWVFDILKDVMRPNAQKS
jgi:hypothetical protein